MQHGMFFFFLIFKEKFQNNVKITQKDLPMKLGLEIFKKKIFDSIFVEDDAEVETKNETKVSLADKIA